MFTGIVTGVGRIREAAALGSEAGHGKRLLVDTPAGFLDDVVLGDSIALNGACMTVVVSESRANYFAVDISAESLACTTGLAEPGPVNLEKAMRANDRLGGHLVSGHVDGIGEVVGLDAVGESSRFAVRAPRALARFLAVKGSITVNGVSLTVNHTNDGPDATVFDINLIPHTLTHTTLGSLKVGIAVNLEIDLIARYVERMLQEGLTPAR